MGAVVAQPVGFQQSMAPSHVPQLLRVSGGGVYLVLSVSREGGGVNWGKEKGEVLLKPSLAAQKTPIKIVLPSNVITTHQFFLQVFAMSNHLRLSKNLSDPTSSASLASGLT